MNHLLGVDIGGTKCAVCLGNESAEVLRRFEVPTAGEPGTILALLARDAEGMLEEGDGAKAIGIVCGGPLDLPNGRILSPPNLPGWDEVAVVDYFSNRFGIPVFLQNDANAGALAEWQFGSGKGSRNLMFCTMGTGFGCGLILDGKLYSGTNGNAGELGHVRLTPDGPVGYGKAGSVEGWCSGGGIAQLARQGKGDAALSAKSLAEAARNGDQEAIDLFRNVGHKLGKALSISVDLLNLETIVIGSIFTRCEELIRPAMEEAMAVETLLPALQACAVKPSGLGERIGDVAALAVAMEGLKGNL